MLQVQDGGGRARRLGIKGETQNWDRLELVSFGVGGVGG